MKRIAFLGCALALFLTLGTTRALSADLQVQANQGSEESKLDKITIPKHEGLLAAAVGHPVKIHVVFGDFAHDQQMLNLLGSEGLPKIASIYKQACDKKGETCKAFQKINKIEVKLDNALAQAEQKYSDKDKTWNLTVTSQYMYGFADNIEFKLQEFFRSQNQQTKK